MKLNLELKELASLFRGKGIREVNIRPQPFMYPAFVKGRKNYFKELEDSLRVLTKRFNK